MLLEPATLLQGRYRIVTLLARGGMGAVYQALDERLGHTVALKQTLMSDPALRAAFEREARLLAALSHPSLPVVSDHFSEAGGQFLVMQFIPGNDLATLLQQQGRPFPLEQVVRWADQLLGALDYLHGRTPPIIHRDIKPQNLKLNERNEIVLLDFGLAKGHLSETSDPSVSLFGYTPKYAPLEQIQGSGTTPRSDLYSVAATLYELLTGVPPTDALTRAAAMVRGEIDPLRPAHELRPDLPRPLSEILLQTLAINPELRPASAAALRAALRQHDGPTLPGSGPLKRFERIIQPDAPAEAIPETRQGQGLPSPPPPEAASRLPLPPPPGSSAGQTTMPVGGKPSAAPEPTGRRRLMIGIALGCSGSLLILILSCAFLLVITPSPPEARTATTLARTAVRATSNDPLATMPPIPRIPTIPPIPTIAPIPPIPPILPIPTIPGAVAVPPGQTRANPLPGGASVMLPGWEVTVIEQVRGEAAYELMRKANRNNRAPDEGREYLLLRVRAVASGSIPQEALGRGDLRVVGNRHVAYPGFAGVPPTPAFQRDGRVNPGEVIEGWSSYLVGQDEPDLILAVGNLIRGEAQFVALTPGAAFAIDEGLRAIRPNQVGARWESPAAWNELVITDDWEVAIKQVIRGEAAWEQIYANNRFTSPPPEGYEYALIWARVRRIADDDRPTLLMHSYFIGSSAATNIDQPAVVVPEPELSALLFPGGTSEGWVVVTLQRDDPDARIVFRGNMIAFRPDDFNTRFFAVDE